jgi:hypothetical protein
MAAMTNILVKDDAATPTEFTLLPVSDNPNALWRSSIAGVPLEGQIRFSLSTEQLKNGSYKLSAKLEVPVMETLGASGTSSGYVAPPKVAYVDPVIVTMFADRRSTSADRMNVLKMMVGLLQGASSTTNTGILANNAAGSAWGNSVLPVPYFFNAAVQPN